MAKMVYKGSKNGTFQKLERWLVNISQTIIEGSFVINTSGKLNAAAATIAVHSIVGVSNSAITTGGTVTSDDAILVDVNPDSLYEMDYTATAPTVDASYDLSNAYTLNQGDTSPAAIQVLEITDTTNARCIVKVEHAYHHSG